MTPSVETWLEESFLPRLQDCLEKVGGNEAMRYATQGGKRIRPQMIFETAMALRSESGCGEEKVFLHDLATCAVSLEMVHAYSLVHDDLPAMDNDRMRRGMPSVHAQFGEASAILCGDALLNAAFEVILQNASTLPPQRADRYLRCGALLSACSGQRGMVGGQISDMELCESDPEKALAMVRGKTAALFQAACGMGAILAGASSVVCEKAQALGENFGILFQLVDDAGDREKDEAEGKVTYYASLGERADAAFALHEKAAREIIDVFPFGEGLRKKMMTLRQGWASMHRI